MNKRKIKQLSKKRKKKREYLRKKNIYRNRRSQVNEYEVDVHRTKGITEDGRPELEVVGKKTIKIKVK